MSLIIVGREGNFHKGKEFSLRKIEKHNVS